MLSLLLSRLNCCHEPELDERNLVTISYRDEAEPDPPPRREPTRPDPEVPVSPLELKVDSLEDPDINTDKEGADPEEEDVLEVEIGDEDLNDSKGEFVVREEEMNEPNVKNKKDQKASEESENASTVKNQEMPHGEAEQEYQSVDADEGRISLKESFSSYQNENVSKRKILFYLLPVHIDSEETAII